MPFYPNFTHLASFDLDGNMVCASLPAAPGITYTDNELYQTVLSERDFVVGGYAVGTVTGQQIIGAAYPLFDDSGLIKGAMGAGLDLAWLQNWLERLAMPPDTVLFVTDSRGSVIATNLPDRVAVGAPIYPDQVRSCFTGPEVCPDGVARSDMVDGVTRLYGYTTLDTYPGVAYVSVGLSQSVVVGPLEESQRLYYVGIVVFALVTMLIISVSAEWLIVEPVHQLVNVTDQLAQGHYDARLWLPRSVEEIERLGITIERLARSLATKEQYIAQHTRDLQQRITEHQKTQAKLRETINLLSQETEARYAAQQADELKRRFLAMVSHELRTPLTSIKGYASSLLADDVEWSHSQQDEFLRIIDEESDNLLDMVEQLLDLSQIDAGTLRIHPVATTACAVLTSARYTLTPLTPLHPLKITCEAQERPGTIYVDTKRVTQVLSNLVNNAVRYTPPGTPIVVNAEPLNPADGEGAVRFTVRDYGPGIAVEKRAILFHPFNRLENEENNRIGIGMGLAICRGIVEAHGGQITVKDPESGAGICFEFTLPRLPDPRHVGDVDMLEIDIGGLRR